MTRTRLHIGRVLATLLLALMVAGGAAAQDAYVRAEAVRWAEVIRSVGLKLD